MKSTDESARGTYEEIIVVDWEKRRKIEQLSEMSNVETLNSISDSSENAVGKASSRTSDASASNGTMVNTKFEACKAPEGSDDCLSFDSGTNEAAKVLTDTNVEVHRINLLQGDEHTIDDQNLSQLRNINSVVDHDRNYRRQCKTSEKFSDQVPPGNLLYGLSSQYPGFEISASKSTVLAADLSITQDTSGAKSLLNDSNTRDKEENKHSPPLGKSFKGSSEHLNSLLTGTVVSDVCFDLPPSSLKCSSEKNDEMEVEVHPMDATDDSDIVEQDVKVCDICGDAGREDLLAICCKCSDGAEHTYCMREMLAKVPEGDWLCEECQSRENTGNYGRCMVGKVDVNEKNSSSGQASSEHINSFAVEGNITRGCLKTTGKRPRDDADAEVSSIVKKPAVESVIGSPKLSRSNKSTALSCDNSLKFLDKGRVQSSQSGLAADDVPVNDTPELARSASDLQVPHSRGTFLKSYSFTSLNSKSKVKLVDQVLQQEKSAKELAPPHLKEGAIRSIGKSLSFKSSIRPESKVKMLPTRLTNKQDIRNTKRQSSFERQSSLKSECLPINLMSSAARSYGKLASPCSVSISYNHHETKPVQLDDKSVVLSRSSSLVARKSADLSSSLGEFKRPSLYGHNTAGVSSANGMNYIDKKSNQTILKEDSSSCSGINANEGLPDGFSQPRDLTNSGGQSREYTRHLNRPLHVKPLKVEDNNLKAATDSAMLRKPGGYKKHRSDDLSASIIGCDIASKDHLSSSSGRRIESSAAELAKRHTVSQNLTADAFKHETLNTVKQFSLLSVETLSSGGDEAEIVPLDISSSKDELSNVEAPMLLSLKSRAIPEHEYIWQGSFEIFRSGKVLVLWDGIQAHLSTSSSPKVIEAVNKFESQLVLSQVPRLSTWPIQFQEHGIGEDNIALFFFAKDLESYDKIYKVLLENMMKKDLALKGNLNGVELLIYPSNLLPENFQRWNMLYFLWAVFRGKKESCFQIMPDSLKQYSARNLPQAIMSLPENRCSHRPITEDLPSHDNVSPEPKVNGSEELSNSLSTLAVNENCDAKASLDLLHSRQNSSYPIAVRDSRASQCQELRDTRQKGGINSICGPFHSTLSTNVSRRNQVLLELDTPVNRSPSHYSVKSPDGNLDMSSKEGLGEKTIWDKMICSQDHKKFKIGAENLSAAVVVRMEEDQVTRGPNMEVNRLILHNNEYLHQTFACMLPRALNARGSQVFPKDDDSHIEPGGAPGRMNNVDCSSSEIHNRGHGDCDDVIRENSENAERHFFPMELHPTWDKRLVDRCIPWKVRPMEENRLTDRVPNLELALGAERKPFAQDFQPLMMENVERKTSEEHVLDRRTIEADDDDDVSAALSLSLSFPFPKEEKMTEPARLTEQLVSRRDCTSASMLIFGDLGDK